MKAIWVAPLSLCQHFTRRWSTAMSAGYHLANNIQIDGKSMPIHVESHWVKRRAIEQTMKQKLIDMRVPPFNDFLCIGLFWVIIWFETTATFVVKIYTSSHGRTCRLLCFWCVILVFETPWFLKKNKCLQTGTVGSICHHVKDHLATAGWHNSKLLKTTERLDFVRGSRESQQQLSCQETEYIQMYRNSANLRVSTSSGDNLFTALLSVFTKPISAVLNEEKISLAKYLRAHFTFVRIRNCRFIFDLKAILQFLHVCIYTWIQIIFLSGPVVSVSWVLFGWPEQCVPSLFDWYVTSVNRQHIFAWHLFSISSPRT